MDPASNRTKTIRISGKWLGWSPSARQFVICQKTAKSSRPTSLPSKREIAQIEKAHQRFHRSKSRRMVIVDVPTSSGGEHQVGLIKALTYRVPKQVLSPDKNPFHWHHAFGDTGHAGGTYTAKVMPALVKDSKGHMFIKRRKGNIFTVDTWLRG